MAKDNHTGAPSPAVPRQADGNGAGGAGAEAFGLDDFDDGDIGPDPAGPAPDETIIVFGNCMARAVARDLNAALGGAVRFEICPISPNRRMSPRIRALLPSMRRVVVQDNSHLADYNLPNLLPPGCRQIGMPQPVLRSPWAWNWRLFPDRLHAPGVVKLFTYHDAGLAHVAEQLGSTDPDRLIAAYRAPDAVLRGRYAHMLDFDTRLLEAMDHTYGGDLGAFVLREHLRLKLFDNPGHPAAALRERLAAFVWAALDLPGPCPVITSPPLPEVRQLPLHPAMAEVAGCQYASETALYEYGELGTVTWEGYVRAYLADRGAVAWQRPAGKRGQAGNRGGDRGRARDQAESAQ